MSRIDEALRRTRISAPDAASAERQSVFVSPWDVEAEPIAAPVHGEPAGAEPAGAATIAATTFAAAPIAARRTTERPRAIEDAPHPVATGESSPVTFSRAARERLALAPDGNPVLVEQFRRLAATLHHAQTASGIRVVMLTSASPNDGKTLTAVNLALVLGESYRRRVLLIDADLRRPSLGNVAGVTNAPGLSDALKAPSDQKLAILQVTPTLMLLPAGRPDPDPMGGLTSVRMRQILEDASRRFDWVILDAPPMEPMADAGLLAQMVDGAVFVVRAGQSQYPMVQRAIDALGRDKILGIVLNGVEHMPATDYAYHEHTDALTK